MITYAIVFVLLIVSVICDIKTSKIKNIYVLSSAVLGISINTYSNGAAGFKRSAAGIVLPVILLGLFFYLRLLGAGDIKLFSAIGALLGWEKGLYIMAYSILAAGVVSFIKLSGSGEMIKGLRSLAMELKLSVYYRSNQVVPFNFSNRHVIKMSPSIAAGVVILVLTKLLL